MYADVHFIRNYDEAIRVMQRATTIPRNTKVNFYDEVRWTCTLIIESELTGTCSSESLGAKPSVQVAQALVFLCRLGRVDRHSGVHKGSL